MPASTECWLNCLLISPQAEITACIPPCHFIFKQLSFFTNKSLPSSLSSSLLLESTLNPGQSQDEEPQWTCNVVQDHKQCNDQCLHGVYGAYTNTRSVAYIPLFKPWIMSYMQYICTSKDKRAESSGIFMLFLRGRYKYSQAAVLVQLDVSLPQLQGLLEHTSSFVLF